jgi:hypothetical protein
MHFLFRIVKKKSRCFIATAFRLQLDYAVWNVKENEEYLELNGKHQLVIYDDLLGENINAIKRNRKAQLDSCKEAV